MADMQQYGSYTGQKEDSFEALPAGEYTAMIVSSEKKQSNNKPQNSYLKLEWEVLEGQYRGRKIFENINLWNDNQQAVEIARKAIDSIYAACGKLNGVKNSEELHRIPMVLKLTVKDGKDGYEASNSIKKHSPMTGGQPVQQAQPASGTMPWQKQS